MEKIRKFLIGFVVLSAFFSLYVGGVLVYLLFFSIALYAGFELIVSLRNKYSLKRQ
jgi:hypothetical protein